MVNKEVAALFSEVELLTERFQKKVEEIDSRIGRIHAICNNIDKLLSDRKKQEKRPFEIRLVQRESI